MKSRVISGIIAVVYLLGAYLGGGGKSLLQTMGFLVLPIACIWYSEEMGGYTGNTGGGLGGDQITSTTPGCLVALGGWLLLFVPVIFGSVWWIMGGR